MACCLLSAFLLVATPADESVVGKVRVSGTSVTKVVSVVVAGEPLELTGEPAAELGRLAAAKVEVIGHREGRKLVVSGYRILDIGGGAKPLVGQLVEVGDGLGLADGDAAPIRLSLAPRSKARLSKKAGAKVWVHGKKLVSGELKVLRYGVLREAKLKPLPAGAGVHKEKE